MAMARKNRVSVPNGIYHVTSRIANGEFLLADDDLKEKIVGWMYDIADFSGVDILSWCIMDNHLHLLVQVPQVPREYWLDPNVEPAAYAQTIRPSECEYPRWTPVLSLGDCPHANGDSPSPETTTLAVGDRADEDRPSAGELAKQEKSFWEALGKIRSMRPPVGFMLTDEQMRERLEHLWGSKAANAQYDEWQLLRANGDGQSVEIRKARLCRRMYNLSQFMKTLKERISMRYNREFRHEGALWQGRFYSGLVEDDLSVKSIVASYIEYNPCRAGLSPSPEKFRWSSFATAVSGGRHSARCRLAYERLLGRPWEECRMLLEAIFADKEAAKEGESERATQAIHHETRVFSHGAYIGRRMAFLEGVLRLMPERFPRPSAASLKSCLRYSWELLRHAA